MFGAAHFTFFCPIIEFREEPTELDQFETCLLKKKTAKLHERKIISREKMLNFAGGNSKSTREQIRSKLSNIIFFHAIFWNCGGLMLR